MRRAWLAVGLMVLWGCPGGTPGPKPTPTPAPTPDPTPTPECSIDGLPGSELEPYATHGPAVNAAILAVYGCDGGRCVVEDGRQVAQAKIIAQLRRQGLCAGQHEPGVTDEIAVSASTTGVRESYHVYAGPLEGPGTLVLSPQSVRPAYAAPGSNPGPTPTPPPTPPPAGACGVPTPPPLNSFVVHRRGCRDGFECYDSTPLVEGAAYCASIGYGRNPCPVRMEGSDDRLACEQQVLGGPAPAWVWTGRPTDGWVNDRNPFGFDVREGAAGSLKVCGADRAVCTVVKP